jgi:hypothetical protein
VTCSMKPTLIEAANEGQLPLKYEDLYSRRKVVGWVKNLESFGAFVAFGGSVEGVVHKQVFHSRQLTSGHLRPTRHRSPHSSHQKSTCHRHRRQR